MPRINGAAQIIAVDPVEFKQKSALGFGATHAAATVAGAPDLVRELRDFILMDKNLVGTVFGSCNPRADIARRAGLYRSGQLQLDEMITRRYRLDDIRDIIDFSVR